MAVSLDSIIEAFRPGELVDDGQIAELKRWRLLDFVAEPDDACVSDSPIVAVCSCGQSGTTPTREIFDIQCSSLAPLPAALGFELDIIRHAIEEMPRLAKDRAHFIHEF